MRKEIIAVLLSITLLVGTLTGCGKSTSDTATSTAGITENTEAKAWTEESATEKEKTVKGESYLDGCYDYDPDFTRKENSEEYSEWEEKGYSSVMKEPVSTFSADVDTASYSNLRRLIREGYSIDELPENAVRIEEMLNYFTYDYKEPEGSEPFGVTAKIGKCPWNEDAELVMLGLKTEDIDYEDAPASNLVFLLDVSGSMYADDKLPLLQEAFCLLADNLTEKEWFTLSIRYKKPAEEESSLLAYPIGFENYMENPDDDFRFAGAVAEFGLLASHSENPEDASVKNVKKILKSIDLDDEYKEEFLELVKEVE